MKQGPRYHVKPRRQREGKTDYRKRVSLLKSRKTRIVVRKSHKNTRVQFVTYEPTGDKIIATALSGELVTKYNWKFSAASTPAAYLTGLLAGKRAKESGIDEGILDMGRHKPTAQGKVFAVLKGVLDAGITCSHDEAKLTTDDRLHGTHIDKEIAPAVDDMKSKIMGDK